MGGRHVKDLNALFTSFIICWHLMKQWVEWMREQKYVLVSSLHPFNTEFVSCLHLLRRRSFTDHSVRRSRSLQNS